MSVFFLLISSARQASPAIVHGCWKQAELPAAAPGNEVGTRKNVTFNSGAKAQGPNALGCAAAQTHL